MKASKNRVATLATAIAAAAIGCSEPRGVTPTITPCEQQRATEDARFARGQQVFMGFCNSCHPSTGAGLGPPLYERPLTGNMIAFQVRHGLGKMPAFGEELISKPQLSDLVYYLDVVEDLPSASRAARMQSGGSAVYGACQ